MLQGSCSLSIPETGEVQWKWYSEPVKMGDPGSDTWPNLDAMRHGGGGPMAPGKLRSAAASLLLGNGKSNSGFFRCTLAKETISIPPPSWPERGYGETGLVFPAVTARYARLGRGSNTGARRWCIQRKAAQSFCLTQAGTVTSSCSIASPASTC